MRHLSLALAAICCLGHHAAAFSPHGVRHSTRSNGMKYSQNSRVRMTETTSDSAPPTQKQFDFSDPLKPVVFGEELIIPFTGNGQINQPRKYGERRNVFLDVPIHEINWT
mmetsp:Transcript_24844/g.36447  ORF Transcript_24844/g.36447 Transcript_24844/m.36447 type:complete len:110 (-) Transcript_24844:987-1316(-)